MQIGAAIYGYRNNFSCKQTTSLRKGRKTKITLLHLIIDGYSTASKYEDDYYVSLVQYLCKCGYPKGFKYHLRPDFKTYFMNALFSVCFFKFENLIINHKKFNVFEWRKQFDLYNEIEISGLNFYRNRSAVPIQNFTSMNDVYKKIFTHPKLIEKELLKFSFNSSWENAKYILGKYCYIDKEHITYKITYGCSDDFENFKIGKACSSWEIRITSEKGENFIDFCLKIYNNYDKIISGDRKILQSKSYDNERRHFHLGNSYIFRQPNNKN